jgi:hypothetical protein
LETGVHPTTAFEVLESEHLLISGTWRNLLKRVGGVR